MRQFIREITFAVLLALLVFAPVFVAAQGVTISPERVAAIAGAVGSIVPALRAAPGCLGVEIGAMQSGKQVIFAWFENRKALLAWYYSDVHKQLMAMTGATPSPHPLADTPDTGPILAIASVTVPGMSPGATPTQAQLMTIPQIAIELYAPVAGGGAAGGRFAPSTVVVPGLKESLGPPKP